MKTVLPILFLAFFTCCGWAQTKKEKAVQKHYPERAVKVLPNDSNKYNMPIQKTDTYRNNMPVIDPDTAKVNPK